MFYARLAHFGNRLCLMNGYARLKTHKIKCGTTAVLQSIIAHNHQKQQI